MYWTTFVRLYWVYQHHARLKSRRNLVRCSKLNFACVNKTESRHSCHLSFSFILYLVLFAKNALIFSNSSNHFRVANFASCCWFCPAILPSCLPSCFQLSTPRLSQIPVSSLLASRASNNRCSGDKVVLGIVETQTIYILSRTSSSRLVSQSLSLGDHPHKPPTC